MATEETVQQHYGRGGIAERVLAALRAVSPDVAVTPEALAPLDHFHGRGVVATEELAKLLDPRPGERILDIGSGIGGPARWIAAKFGVHAPPGRRLSIAWRMTSLRMPLVGARTSPEFPA